MNQARRPTNHHAPWSAILLGSVAVLMVLVLVEHLTPPADRPERDDAPEA
ncbi:hypothetical protein ACFXKC_44350 [Streptomyces sp. NPDC059340]